MSQFTLQLILGRTNFAAIIADAYSDILVYREFHTLLERGRASAGCRRPFTSEG